jgi:hypothetical protein
MLGKGDRNRVPALKKKGAECLGNSGSEEQATKVWEPTECVEPASAGWRLLAEDDCQEREGL